MPQFDDFKVVGLLFCGLGALQVGVGVAGLWAEAAAASLLLLAGVALGVLFIVVGVGAYRHDKGHRVAVGVCAFLAAPSFPLGTAVAAVAFVALGKSWSRLKSTDHEKDAA